MVTVTFTVTQGVTPVKGPSESRHEGRGLCFMDGEAGRAWVSVGDWDWGTAIGTERHRRGRVASREDSHKTGREHSQ